MGIERSSDAKQIAIQNCIDFGFPVEEKQLIVGGIEEIDKLEDESFDLIIDRLSLAQMCKDEAKEYISSLRNKMKKGGIFISLNFTDNHREIMNSTGHQINGYYTEFYKGDFYGSGGRQFYNLTLLKELFREFELLEVELNEARSLINEPNGVVSEIITVAQKA